jgi:hypothetical protein
MKEEILFWKLYILENASLQAQLQCYPSLMPLLLIHPYILPPNRSTIHCKQIEADTPNAKLSPRIISVTPALLCPLINASFNTLKASPAMPLKYHPSAITRQLKNHPPK